MSISKAHFKLHSVCRPKGLRVLKAYVVNKAWVFEFELRPDPDAVSVSFKGSFQL